MPDFLFEIGLEEVPARMLAGAQAELLKRTIALLTREQLIGADPVARSYSTPRRLAVLIENVREQQDDISEDTTGPAVKIAFKDGIPTPAAEAFARKSGVTVAELRTISTPKGEYLAATSVKKGRSAAEVIASELPKEITAIYWAKTMYWRAGKPERFVRPVVWMVCLLGECVVPVVFGGKTAGRATFGHRVLSSGEAFEIVAPASYVAQLEGEYVIADVGARRHKIRKALDKVMREVEGARWREDESLVDAVTHLTEWPDVLLGHFEADYLELPEEVLVMVMRDHQKYFAVEDAEGKLAPHFLTVTNIALDETNAAIIRQGNERVLRARFNDARFFWEFDQRTPLVERVKLLETVTFQKDLGSYAKKSERVLKICRTLAELAESRGVTVNLNALTDAAGLAKTDLSTELVKEFTELQGVIGGLYFKAEAEKNPRLAADPSRVDITSQAIYDQYLPASAKDGIPRSTEGCILGLSDRIDNIACMFGLGLEPTGSKDPFALRRAANAIIRILAESPTVLPVGLGELIEATGPNELIGDAMAKFLMERLEFHLRENRGYTVDIVRAVFKATARFPDNVRDVGSRAEALFAARGGEDFIAVCDSFKRMKNILRQSPSTDDIVGNQDPAAAIPSAQSNLLDAASSAADRFTKLTQLHQYGEALREAALLRPYIDAFFEQVMVLDSNPVVRFGRLSILRMIVARFSQIADFSEIVSEGMN